MALRGLIGLRTALGWCRNPWASSLTRSAKEIAHCWREDQKDIREHKDTIGCDYFLRCFSRQVLSIGIENKEKCDFPCMRLKTMLRGSVPGSAGCCISGSRLSISLVLCFVTSTLLGRFFLFCKLFCLLAKQIILQLSGISSWIQQPAENPFHWAYLVFEETSKVMNTPQSFNDSGMDFSWSELSFCTPVKHGVALALEKLRMFGGFQTYKVGNTEKSVYLSHKFNINIINILLYLSMYLHTHTLFCLFSACIDDPCVTDYRYFNGGCYMVIFSLSFL